jgi:Tfp pilus assembly protein PilV
VTRGGGRGERGSSIIEVMIATSMLIIAAAGFAGTSQYAAGSTRIGHRRTAATFLRAGLIDRLHVTPRSILRGIAAATESTWLVDACYDVSAQRVASNASYAVDFACPDTTYYRSWINVTDNDAGGGAWAATTNSWTVGLYVERVDASCASAERDGSVGCVSADLLLTD